MNKIILIVLITLIINFDFLISQDNVGIGTTNPDETAILHLESSEKGFIIPRMTDVERDAITSPATGLIVYVTTDNNFYYFDGTSWIPLISNVVNLQTDVTGTLPVSNGGLGSTGLTGMIQGDGSNYSGLSATTGELTYWSSDDAIDGLSALTWDGTDLTLSGGLYTDSLITGQIIYNPSTVPTFPSEGMVYYDNIDNELKVYNGTSWESVAGASATFANGILQGDGDGVPNSLSASADQVTFWSDQYTISGSNNLTFDGSSLSLTGDFDATTITTDNILYNALGSAPSSPTTGTVYYDSGDNELKVWNGTAWVSLLSAETLPLGMLRGDGTTTSFDPITATSGEITYWTTDNEIAGLSALTWDGTDLTLSGGLYTDSLMTGQIVYNPSTVPTYPSEGMVYYDNNDNELKIYNGVSWESVSGTSSTYPTGVLQGNGTSTANGLTAVQNQVTYWSDANTIAGSANLTFDGSSLSLTGDFDATTITTDNILYNALGSAPSSPTTGTVYYDSGDNELKVWNGTAWVSLLSAETLPLGMLRGDGTTTSFDPITATSGEITYWTTDNEIAGLSALTWDGTDLNLSGGLYTDSLMTDQILYNPTSTPTYPSVGMVYYDSTDNELKVYNGSSWADVAGVPGSGFWTQAGDSLYANSQYWNVKWQQGKTKGANNATAWGSGYAANWASTAWGTNSKSTGNATTAWGSGTTASVNLATAWGDGTTASANASTAWGTNTIASNHSTTAWGNNTEANANMATAWGEGTTASGNKSTAFGTNTTASGDHSTAFGFNSESSAQYAISFGVNSVSSEQYAVSWGDATTASGQRTTAWGKSTVASNELSTAWGESTTASGRLSTALGYNTTAYSGMEFVIGQYNTTYSPSNNWGWYAGYDSDRLFVAGIGTGTSDRKDAMIIYKDGVSEFFGNVLINSNTTSASELQFFEPSGSGTNYTAFKAQAQGSDITYILPAADGASSEESILVTDGAGNLSWSNTVAWNTVGNASTDSTVNFLGTTDAQPLIFKTNDTERMKLHTNGALQLGNAGVGSGELIMYSDQATDYSISFTPSDTTKESTNYILPPQDGEADDILVTDGAGNLEWRPLDGAQFKQTLDLYIKVIRKPSDESLSNSTVLQNDDNIKFDYVADEKFAFDGAIIAYCTASQPDFKFIFEVASGTNMTVSYLVSDESSNSNTFAGLMNESTVNPEELSLPGGDHVIIFFRGFLDAGTSNGTLQLKWAQLTSNSTPITITTDSFIRITKVTEN